MLTATVAAPVLRSLANPAGSSPLFESAQDDPTWRGLQDQVRTLEGRLEDTNQLLGMSSWKRRQFIAPELYNAAWSERTRFHASTAAHLALFGACAGGMAAMLTGAVNPLVGLLGGGVLLGGGYVQLAKRVILPLQVDKGFVLPSLQKERQSLERALQSTKAAGEEYQARQRADALRRLQEDRKARQETEAQAPTPIRVEEASVVIGGVRVPIRKGN